MRVQQGGNQKCYVRHFESSFALLTALDRIVADLGTLHVLVQMVLGEDRVLHPVSLPARLLQVVPSTLQPYLPLSATVVVVPTTWPGTPRSRRHCLSSIKISRDCLASSGNMMDAIPTGPAAGNLNKNKTCYKCQQEGHVSNVRQSLAPVVTLNSRLREIVLRMPILLAEFQELETESVVWTLILRCVAIPEQVNRFLNNMIKLCQ